MSFRGISNTDILVTEKISVQQLILSAFGINVVSCIMPHCGSK